MAQPETVHRPEGHNNDMENTNLQHVFIIGCKGIPAAYGGFETFADKLASCQSDSGIRYHVACAAEPEDYDKTHRHYRYCHAFCTVFPWRRIGAGRAIVYDLEALAYFIRYVEKKQIPHPIFYILACRIGPWAGYFEKKIHSIGGKLYVNPDGHEFLRAKWSVPVRRYWKYSESLMVRHADMLICDSRHIRSYIRSEYQAYHPDTEFIAYGADITPSPISDEDQTLREWYDRHGIERGNYYLAVGRFVPENNYGTMIREFMRAQTDKKLVFITDAKGSFYEELKAQTHFERDARICFAGTVYDQALLKKIRENAYGSLHGHEVGGTNPSLLEALASTDLNLLFDVGFNREVARGSACYWTKEPGSLAGLIEEADAMPAVRIAAYGKRAKDRIKKYYSWEYITKEYESLFCRYNRRNDICVEL